MHCLTTCSKLLACDWGYALPDYVQQAVSTYSCIEQLYLSYSSRFFLHAFLVFGFTMITLEFASPFFGEFEFVFLIFRFYFSVAVFHDAVTTFSKFSNHTCVHN
eukprot:scpid106406/ scgid17436/ 